MQSRSQQGIRRLDGPAKPSVDGLIEQIETRRARIRQLEREVAALQSQVSTILSTIVYAGPPLTPRQKQVLKMLVEDKSNKQIGAAVGISERTAKFHVSALLARYRKTNRRELGDLVRGGLIELDA